MKPFIHDDFLLENDLAKHLYHTYAKDLPIIDYHCHLDPKSVYENENFTNLGEVWLGGDHYKWRLMRAFGIDEKLITGNASFSEKLYAYAELLPSLFGNPILHWSQLELKRYFGVDELFNEDTVKEIERVVNKKLENTKPADIFNQFKVEMVGTTDDPTDDLIWHKKIREENITDTVVAPTFRPDKLVNIDQDTFLPWIEKLSKVHGKDIKDLFDLKMALIKRLDFFNEMGSIISDHGLDTIVYAESTEEIAATIFKKRMENEALTPLEVAQYKSHLMYFFGKEYHARNMVQQYHIGAYRNTNTLQYKTLGVDKGYDTILDTPVIESLRGLLDQLFVDNVLPKTIVYSVNQKDYDTMMALIQAFQAGEKGKVQLGAAWWFQDNIDGMRKQMRSLMSNGVFSTFIGMLTDSRSYLSYTRHEYFRRLLCQMISEEVNRGLYPNDEKRLGKLVQDISYYNAKAYLNLN